MNDFKKKLKLAEKKGWTVLIITKSNHHYVGKVRIFSYVDPNNQDRTVWVSKYGSSDSAGIQIKRSIAQVLRVDPKDF